METSLRLLSRNLGGRLGRIATSNRHLHKLALHLLKLERRLCPIRGRDNRRENSGVTIRVRYDIVGNHNRVIFRKGAVLSDLLIYMRGDHHVLEIGEGCRVDGGTMWFEDRGGVIRIGKSTSMSAPHVAVTEPGRSIFIGEDCMFSNDVEIRTGDSHSIVDKSSGRRINPPRDVVIGNHVWVGAHAVILKGSRIGSGTIVGTGALVVSRIGQNRLASGVPAVTLMSDVTWRAERLYEQDTDGTQGG